VRKKKVWDLFLLLIMMIVDDDYCFGAAGFSQVVAI
jgi:hypothetical protein